MRVNRSHWPGLLFDTHCHLHFPDFADDLDTVVRNALEAGVRGMLVPSVDLDSSFRSSSIAEGYDLWSAAGFHPNHLEGASEEAFEEVAGLSLLPQAAAVGETGLDFYRNRFARHVQEHWFERHVKLSNDLGLPLLVHSRGAEEEVLEVIPESHRFPVILHSWCGGAETTRRAAARGFFFGVTGAVTYKKSSLPGILGLIPRGQLLVETDAPFLPPEPCRGTRNQPCNVPVIAARIGLELGLSLAQTFETLWNNSLRALLLSPETRRTQLVYPIGDRLYVNITGRCNASCRFCVRVFQDGIAGYHLRHRFDPSRESVLAALGAVSLAGYSEVVFCGFGEPTMRPDMLVEAADLVRAAGVATRLNTNGLCLDHMTVCETEAMLGRFTRLSVSLNASSTGEHRRICRSSCSNGWESLMAFIGIVRRLSIPAVLTAVAGSGADMGKVRGLADRFGLPLMVRGQQ